MMEDRTCLEQIQDFLPNDLGDGLEQIAKMIDAFESVSGDDTAKETFVSALARIEKLETQHDGLREKIEDLQTYVGDIEDRASGGPFHPGRHRYRGLMEDFVPTPYEEILITRFEEEVLEHSHEIDPLDEQDWYSLTLGFFLGMCVIPLRAHTLTVYVRYTLNLG